MKKLPLISPNPLTTGKNKQDKLQLVRSLPKALRKKKKQ